MSIIKSTNYAIQKAVSLVGDEVINKLEEFYLKTSKLEHDYKTYALEFIKETLKVNHSMETKKNLTDLLLDLGFKKSNVSSMLGAQDFINLLEARGSQATDYVKSLPVSTAYRLSTCSEDAFSKIWANDSKFGEVQLSRNEVMQLKNKYDKPVQKFDRANSQHSDLHKALKLVSDYPDVVELIQQKIDQDT